jgi:hypothetical protein
MKRSVTLIELMIGCTLLAVLLSFLFGLIREVKVGERVIRVERERLLERERVEMRLDQLFLQTIHANAGGNPLFYTDQEGALVFMAEVGATFDPPFVDRVLCRINCQEGALFLDTWPDPEKFGTSPQEMRRETLLSKVDSISWEFFSPPNPNMVIDPLRIGQDEENQEPPTDEWLSVWKVGYRKIPPLLQLTIERENEMIKYATFLPATSYPIEVGP